MRLATLGLLLLAAGASAQDARTAAFDGALDALDDTLTTGEAVDRYVFDVAAGEEVTVEMVSDAFDTWLVLKRPGAPNLDNDDWNGSRRVSRIVARADSAGTFEALATSYAPGMTGAYRITVSSVPPASVTASPRDADGFAGTVWAADCPGARASRTYLGLGAGGALRASLTSSADLAEDLAEAGASDRWLVADGALVVTHGATAMRFPLTGAAVLRGTSSDVCADGARLLRLPAGAP